jgi:putative transposase
VVPSAQAATPPTPTPTTPSPSEHPAKGHSKQQPQSHNDHKAWHRLARAQLPVHRQREDCARKTARALVSSHDLMAHEDLRIRNLVKNHQLAKCLQAAAWGRFLAWVLYYVRLHGIPVSAVPAQYTTQACSGCGTLVSKTLSTRTHVCGRCGLILDRDEHAARNILALAVRIWQQVSTLKNSTAGQAGAGSA